MYGVLPLALLLVLSQARSSYAEAGVVVGGYGLAAGALGPVRARLVDRVGASRALPALAAGLALSLLVLLAAARAPMALVAGLGVLAGCFPPPVGPVMRAAWRRLVRGEEGAVRRAYSLDAVTEEAAYVLGPVLATGLLARLGGGSVVAGCAAVVVLAGCAMGWRFGALMLRLGPSTASVPRADAGLWRDVDFLLGLVPVAALGLVLGAVEVGAVAAALATVGVGLAGVPSTALALGSLAGGLVYGRRPWPGAARAHTVVLTSTTSLLVAAAGFTSSSFGLLVATLALAGVTIAPAIIASYLVADEAVPLGSSQATAWVNAAFNCALASGTALAGVVVDAASPRAALCGVGAVAALLVVAVGSRR